MARHLHTGPKNELPSLLRARLDRDHPETDFDPKKYRPRCAKDAEKLRLLAEAYRQLILQSLANRRGSFHSYPCTVDCSGHEAGYEWAEENGVSDPGECDGNSNSFIEGCEAYAEEQQDEIEQDESDASGDE